MKASIEHFERALARVRELLSDDTYPCAAVAASQGGDIRVSCLNAGGERDDSLRRRPFLLASITKPIVSAAVAVLVEEGKLAYDTPLAAFFPEMAGTASAAVEVGDVFTHTTGFCTGVEVIDPEQFTPATYYRHVLARGPSYPHRTKSAYSTMTYHFVNALVPMLTGLSLPEFLAQRVFGPLGMASTGFHPAAGVRMPVRGFESSFPGKTIEAYCRSEMSGAGIWSTVDDLLAFGRAYLVPGRLLKAETIAACTRVRHSVPMLNQEDALSARTFGWNKATQFAGQPKACFGHGGATGTLLMVDPDSDLVFVLLTNHWGCPSANAASAMACLYE